MRRIIVFMSLMCLIVVACHAQMVTVNAVDMPAADVFRMIVTQTGKKFIYPSELLTDVRVTMKVDGVPMKQVLDEMFRGLDIEYKIKGRNVVLKRRETKRRRKSLHAVRPSCVAVGSTFDTVAVLDEVVVSSRLEAPGVVTAEIGAKKITADEVRRVPALLGENDVIKTLHMQPGVVAGTDGMAAMYVHGGNADENLCMLDNVPMYQVNHFAGLFSAFNTDVIRYIDFFKTSVPAKYDGRLSSFMDVRLQNGLKDGHHGSVRLGLTSGAFNLSGPIGGRTSYLVGVRRSWYEAVTAPLLAIANHHDKNYKTRARYSFMDFNAKVSHRFSSRLNGFVSAYFGDDVLKTGSTEDREVEYGYYAKDKYDFHWGNFVAQIGLNYRIRPELTAEFTVAYTRYFSSIRCDNHIREQDLGFVSETSTKIRNDNNITDWIFRGDFDWHPNDNSLVRFGGCYTRHSFLPERALRQSIINEFKRLITDSVRVYGANEFNVYAEDDWTICDRLRVNVGVHGSLFAIDGRTRGGVSPRLSVNYRPATDVAIKAAYSRTVQYVHQLVQSYLALPTDRWIPIIGKFRPQTADKVAVGAYWQFGGGYAMSVEGYYKVMRNILDYCDEYYLMPPSEAWNARLTYGSGTAKGIDFKIEKTVGKLTGHICYSLAWADRKFREKKWRQEIPGTI